MKKAAIVVLLGFFVTGCLPGIVPFNISQTSATPTNVRASTPVPTITSTEPPPQSTPAKNPGLAGSVTKSASGIPNFDHIVMIMLENRSYSDVIGSNTQMPLLSNLANQNVLLTNYFAVSHPSLPNYIALMSGSTQNITKDCTGCYVNKPNLADLIESSGRTWKAYMDGMPSPCFMGNSGNYVQKHDPLIYFDSIHQNTARCNRSIVPLAQLTVDLTNNHLPSFSYIMPDLCNSGHSCSASTSDKWVNGMVTSLQASSALGNNSLIIIAFDEASTTDSTGCCGLPPQAGGHVAVVLISPSALPGMTDASAYDHYSLLKTILLAWGLPLIGETAQDATNAIVMPWGGQVNPTSSQASPQPPSATQLAGTSLKFPIRAAFYYPWYPEAWNQAGLNPFTHYHPSLGFYTQDDPTVIPKQISAMQYAKIQLGIVSWRTPGQFTDIRFPALLQDGEKVGFHWALYMESPAEGDLTVAAISSNLQYIRDHYASSPAYLKINGRFVIFVYSLPTDNCALVDRWIQANTVNAYLVLKAFVGYQSCKNQPDLWHQYAPAAYQRRIGNMSFTISPGFWKADEKNPRLARDLTQWKSAIRAMIASNAQFQLITSFNEWGEGTAIESASEWPSPSGFGLYLDALHYDGNPPS